MSLAQFVLSETAGNPIEEIGYGEYNEEDQSTELEAFIYGPQITMYTEEGAALFKAFCLKHNVYYYAECKENFFMYKAWDEARAAGARYLLADNMS